MVIHQNGTKNRDHSGKAEKKTWNETSNFYSRQKKKQSFSTKMANEQHFCVPRKQMPLSQGRNTTLSRKHVSREAGGRGGRISYFILLRSWGSFFYGFMVILSLLQLQLLFLLVSLAKSA